jgi:hypothetical protein
VKRAFEQNTSAFIRARVAYQARDGREEIFEGYFTRMSNLLAVLRDMPKPSSGEFGGKGAFWFCEEREVDLQRPVSFLHLNWRSVSGVDDGRSLAP